MTTDQAFACSRAAGTVGLRLARRIRALDTDLAANHAALKSAVAAQAPELLDLRGVGPVVAATVLHAWSHPGRITPKPPSPPSAASRRSRHPRAKPTGTGSTTAATDA